MQKGTLSQPVKPQPPKRKKQAAVTHRGRPFTMDDALWSIVGIGKSKGPADVSTNKSKYLADAYDPQEAWVLSPLRSLGEFSLIPRRTML